MKISSYDLFTSENYLTRIDLLYLYLSQIYTYLKCEKVESNWDATGEIPNEMLMRTIEELSGITEEECVKFRIEILKSLFAIRLDIALEKLGDALDYLVDSHMPEVQQWLNRYSIYKRLDLLFIPLQETDLSFLLLDFNSVESPPNEHLPDLLP